MKTFEELGLSKEFLQVVEKSGFKIPSEIQEKTIPLALKGKDIIGGSATGSGKTLAFAASIIENLKPGEYPQSLILTPTRELAEQVAKEMAKFSKYKKLNVCPVYGGVSIEPQIKKLADTDIVVGTPGRILDHLDRRTLRLDHVKFLVLDEVDRMFDMGFHIDVEKIIKECPTKRQTMMFSATISADVDYFAQKYTKDPCEISVQSCVDPAKLTQIYYDVDDKLKFALLVHLLKKDKSDLAMVFCSTRNNVDFVATNLNNCGIRAKAIHGGMAQNRRTNVLQEFHEKDLRVLVCTDVAARGLDIKEVSHVYNYDIPKTSDEYIHRIGRTARAGEKGKAVNLLCSRDYENFGNITQDPRIAPKQEKTPYIERVNIIIPQAQRRGFEGPRRFEGRNNNPRRFGNRENNRSPRQSENKKPFRKSFNSSSPRKSFGRR